MQRGRKADGTRPKVAALRRDVVMPVIAITIALMIWSESAEVTWEVDAIDRKVANNLEFVDGYSTRR
jgi:hypothetical protein